jgi:hypothetical protein
MTDYNPVWLRAAEVQATHPACADAGHMGDARHQMPLPSSSRSRRLRVSRANKWLFGEWRFPTKRQIAHRGMTEQEGTLTC